MPGWRFRTSLAASMPSRLNDGGMRISVTSTLGAVAVAPATVSS